MYSPDEDAKHKVRYINMINKINKHNIEFDEGKWSYIQGVSKFTDLVSFYERHLS